MVLNKDFRQILIILWYIFNKILKVYKQYFKKLQYWDFLLFWKKTPIHYFSSLSSQTFFWIHKGSSFRDWPDKVRRARHHLGQQIHQGKSKIGSHGLLNFGHTGGSWPLNETKHQIDQNYVRRTEKTEIKN